MPGVPRASLKFSPFGFSHSDGALSCDCRTVYVAQRRLPLRLSSTKSMVHSLEAHSRTLPRRSLASKLAASASTGKRTCDKPSAALSHCVSTAPDCARTRKRAGVRASAEFSSPSHRFCNGCPFAMPVKIERRRSRTPIALARSAALPSIVHVMLRQAAAFGRRKYARVLRPLKQVLDAVQFLAFVRSARRVGEPEA